MRHPVHAVVHVARALRIRRHQGGDRQLGEHRGPRRDSRHDRPKDFLEEGGESRLAGRVGTIYHLTPSPSSPFGVPESIGAPAGPGARSIHFRRPLPGPALPGQCRPSRFSPPLQLPNWRRDPCRWCRSRGATPGPLRIEIGLNPVAAKYRGWPFTRSTTSRSEPPASWRPNARPLPDQGASRSVAEVGDQCPPHGGPPRVP